MQILAKIYLWCTFAKESEESLAPNLDLMFSLNINETIIVTVGPRPKHWNIVIPHNYYNGIFAVLKLFHICFTPKNLLKFSSVLFFMTEKTFQKILLDLILMVVSHFWILKIMITGCAKKIFYTFISIDSNKSVNFLVHPVTIFFILYLNFLKYQHVKIYFWKRPQSPLLGLKIWGFT